MEINSVVLQQFARLPRPGQVKTRLQTALTAEQACEVHCELLLGTAGALLGSELGPVELWLDRLGEHPAIEHCLAAGLRGPYQQQGQDLGARMAQAMCEALKGVDAVLLVGSDCPGLDAAYLRTAVDALRRSEVVFGPADDGGYVLIGSRVMAPDLFVDVEWGSARALAQSERCVRARGWTLSRLAPRFDVDTPEDLRRWRAQASAGMDACA